MTAVASHDLDALLEAHRSDERRLPGPAESRYTREEIIEAIQRWNTEHGEPPKVFDWDPSWARRRDQAWRAERFERGDWPTIAIVRRQFGNLSKAIFAAGLRPRRGPARGRSHLLTDEQLLDAIREWTKLYGEPPATADWAPARARSHGQTWRLDRYYAGDWPSTNTVIRRFGTFSEAIRLAGLDPRPRGRHTTAQSTIDRGAREVIERSLNSGNLTSGPTQLAANVRAVAEARSQADIVLLRSSLIELAASALSWADIIDKASRPLAA
ncbi:homing endonuclease associated repeat-containing protein [Solirubrobacter soli]|uniref:homing endonuclease associated repeat-containing protein n=1 Tax=Solirubrobacter soli TaxID=363832 RepID=UPI000423F66E|nr:hypothetical protein [Solirubrobacter soli]